MDHSSAASSATSGLCKSQLWISGSSRAPTAPPGMGCSHCPALLEPDCRLGATNSCNSGPDSSFGSLQHGQPIVLQPLLMSLCTTHGLNSLKRVMADTTSCQVPHGTHKVIMTSLTIVLDSSCPEVLYSLTLNNIFSLLYLPQTGLPGSTLLGEIPTPVPFMV